MQNLTYLNCDDKLSICLVNKWRPHLTLAISDDGNWELPLAEEDEDCPTEGTEELQGCEDRPEVDEFWFLLSLDGKLFELTQGDRSNNVVNLVISLRSALSSASRSNYLKGKINKI